MSSESVLLAMVLSILSPISSLPSSPISLPPIPAAQLYAGKILPPSHATCVHHNIVYMRELGGRRCMVDQVVATDYTCRYSVGRDPACYCCGEIYTFVELGRICTKFCKKDEDELQKPKVGQEPVIILPFGWGEGPDKVELEEV